MGPDIPTHYLRNVRRHVGLQREPYPSLLAFVGFGTMDDGTMVDRHFTWLQNQVNALRLVNLSDDLAARQDIVFSEGVFMFADLLPMTSRVIVMQPVSRLLGLSAIQGVGKLTSSIPI